MKRGRSNIRTGLFIIYLILLHVLAGYLLFREIRHNYISSQNIPELSDPTISSPVPTPIPVPSLLADLSPEESVPTGELDLTVPVAGVRLDQLTDTFDAARGEGRDHDAIDIIAAEGTPVVAATDGTIARFFDSIPGGTTIYQFTADRKYILYYAHLQKRVDGLKAGDQVARGQVIGFVGDTGNAGKGNFHLHFSVALVRDPARYWEGEYLNPFHLFKRSAP